MPAIRVAGVEIIPTRRARSSFRLGSSASALIPSAFSDWVPSAPPTTTNFSLVLANSTAVFATPTGSVDHASAIGPFSSDLRLSNWVPSRARCGQPVLRDFISCPRGSHLAPQVGHLGDRQTRIAGHDNHRSGGQRLIKPGDELAFLRAIHVSSPFDEPSRARRKGASGCPKGIRISPNTPVRLSWNHQSPTGANPGRNPWHPHLPRADPKVH